MKKTVVKGALAAGFVLWIWSTIYWAISGIPIKGMKQFKSDAAVERVLRENAQGPGYYAIPTAYTPKGADASTFAEARMKTIAEEFFFAGAVRVGGLGPLGCQIVGSLLGNVLAAGLLTWLLLQTTGLCFGSRVLFVEAAAVAAWLIGNYPMMIWWGHPCGWVALQLLDFLIGWGLAGCVLARITVGAEKV